MKRIKKIAGCLVGVLLTAEAWAGGTLTLGSHVFTQGEVREKVDPTENFVSYLCTIARNLSMNMYQHQTVEYIYTEYLLKSNPDRDHQTEESTDLRFLNDYIDSLAEELPPSRKKIFLLSKRQGYTNKEIAEKMGISESTVATQLSLAVKFMREQFAKHYDKLILVLWAFFVNEMQ